MRGGAAVPHSLNLEKHMAEKYEIGNDKDGKPIYANAWFVEQQEDGAEKKYPALIEREYDSEVRIMVSENKAVRRTERLADLRVDFGTLVVRALPSGSMAAQKEYKPVFGAARRGASFNPTSRRYWEPMKATAAELAEMDDAVKSSEQLLAEVRELRQAKAATSKADEFAIMSDADLRAHAKSLGVKIEKETSRAEIIKSIEEKEK